MLDKPLNTKCISIQLPRFPKEHCFLEGYWASLVRPSGKNNMEDEAKYGTYTNKFNVLLTVHCDISV